MGAAAADVTHVATATKLAPVVSNAACEAQCINSCPQTAKTNAHTRTRRLCCLQAHLSPEPVTPQTLVPCCAVPRRSYAKGFATFGALYSFNECLIEKYRAKHDKWNPALAGCATGAMMAYGGAGISDMLHQAFLTFFYCCRYARARPVAAARIM